MRGACLIVVAACGRGAVPVAAPPPVAPAIVVAPDAAVDAEPSQDDQIAALLPSRSDEHKKLSLAEVLQRAAMPDGAVPGAPHLIVVNVVDATRCGGAEQLVFFVGAPGGTAWNDEQADGMTITTIANSQDAATWKRDMVTRARGAYDALGPRIDASHGQARVAGLARRVLISRRYVAAILHVKLPRTGAPFCDALAANLSDTVHQLDADATACRAEATAAALGPGWWDAACAAP